MAKIIRKRPGLTSRGTGKPDYSEEIWRGKIFKRIALKPNESLKGFMKVFSTTPSPYPFVVSPLAPGESAYLRDMETGLDMPYTIHAGYELEVLMLWVSTDQETRNFMEFDGFLSSEYYLPSKQIYYESEVFEFTSKNVDPTFSLPHTIAFGLTNLGEADMHGTAEVICILRYHGTEIPKTKTVKCKWCGTERTVPINTTKFKCPNCNKETWFMYFPWGK